MIPKLKEHLHNEIQYFLSNYQRILKKINKKEEKISNNQKIIEIKLQQIKKRFKNFKKTIKVTTDMMPAPPFLMETTNNNKLQFLEFYEKINEMTDRNISFLKNPSTLEKIKKSKKYTKITFANYLSSRRFSTNVTLARFENNEIFDFDEMKKILASQYRKPKFSFDILQYLQNSSLISERNRGIDEKNQRIHEKKRKKLQSLHPALIKNTKNSDTSRNLLSFSSSFFLLLEIFPVFFFLKKNSFKVP